MLQLILTVISLLIISITMLLRANDLKLKGLRWNIRRIGFVLAGFTPVGIVWTRIQTDHYGGWYLTLFFVGVALVFMTTPYLIPWHKWLWRDTDERHVA